MQWKRKKVRVENSFLKVILSLSIIFSNIFSYSVNVNALSTNSENKTEATLESILINNEDSKVGEMLSSENNKESGQNSPLINVELQNNNNNKYELGEEIEIKYEIQPLPYIPDSNSGSENGNNIEEVVFVVDMTKLMNEGERWQGIKNELTNQIITHSSFGNMKVGVVPFNSTIIKPNDISVDLNKLYNFSDSNERDRYRVIFQESKISPTDDTSRNLGQAVNVASELLETKGDSNKNKAIVLISSGDVNNLSSVDLNAIKNKGYKVISMDLSGTEGGNNTFKAMHTDLGGANNEFFVTTYTSNENKFQTKHMKNTLDKVRDSITSGITSTSLPNTISINDFKLTFDLGSKFSHVSGLQKENELYTVMTEPITYSLNNGVYTAPNQIVTFKVNGNEVGVDMSFTSGNKRYSFNEQNINPEQIELPKITIGVNLPNIRMSLKELDKSFYQVREEIRISYEVNPQPFNKKDIGSLNNEIVFIVDTTGKNDKYSELTKYINEIIVDGYITSNKSSTSIIVSDSSNSKIILEKSKKISDIKSSFSSILRTEWDTTPKLTPALNAADKILSDSNNGIKNIVIISMDDVNYNESTLVGMKNKGYNIISLNMGNKDNNSLDLHKILDGKDENYIQIGNKGHYEDAVNAINNALSNKSNNTFSITDAVLNLDLGDIFTFVNSDFLKSVDGSKVTLNIPEIKYVLDKDDQYVSNSTYLIDFKIYAENEGEQLTFSDNGNMLSYSAVVAGTNEIVNKSVEIPKINIRNTNESYEVKMKVSDTGSIVPKSYDYQKNGADYIVNNEGATYKLYGKSNVDISFEGHELTDLRYQFVKRGDTIDENNWKYISGNSDVKINEPGYLTQMPYDVSHMALLKDNVAWSNRQEVFKTAFSDQAGPISMEVSKAHNHDNCSSDQNHYVTAQQVTNSNGHTVTRYVPKTLFVQNHNVSKYAPQYKEASKTWGYIKVPKEGDYWFQTWADDGFYGAITVDGKAIVIGDDFKPRGSSAINSKTSVHLKAGEYYPIYLEYFNWGGSADYRILYREDKNQNFTPMDKSMFYPSNSDAPTDGSNNIFMGNSTVSFATDPGIYTIHYEVGKKDGDEFKVKGEGTYGEFEIEERFNLTKKLSNDQIDLNEPFNLTYILSPKPIKLTDFYKTQDLSNITVPSSLEVKQILFADTLPEGFTLVSEGQTKLNRTIDVIKYTNIGNEFSAANQEIGFSIKANSMEANFNEPSGELNYRDVALDDGMRISQRQLFTDTPLLNIYENSLITKHGLFNNKTIIDGPVVTVNPMNYMFGFIIEARGLNNSFVVTIPNGVKIDANKVYLYELDSSDNIIKDSKVNLKTNGLTIRFEDDKTGSIIKNENKYAIVYQSNNILENSIINAKMDAGSYKDLKITTKAELPDLL